MAKCSCIFNCKFVPQILVFPVRWPAALLSAAEACRCAE